MAETKAEFEKLAIFIKCSETLTPSSAAVIKKSILKLGYGNLPPSLSRTQETASIWKWSEEINHLRSVANSTRPLRDLEQSLQSVSLYEDGEFSLPVALNLFGSWGGLLGALYGFFGGKAEPSSRIGSAISFGIGFAIAGYLIGVVVGFSRHWNKRAEIRDGIRREKANLMQAQEELRKQIEIVDHLVV